MPARLVISMLGGVADPTASNGATVPESGTVLGGGLVAMLIALVAVIGLLWAAWSLWRERPTPF